MSNPHIVLVHGAWHQPLHWNPLIKILQAAGYQTSAPKLPSSGFTSPSPTLEADTAAIRQPIIDAIAQGATAVIPVLHSFAGVVGFEALATLTAEQKAKIPRVVCISAIVVPKGGSVSTINNNPEKRYIETEGDKLTISDAIAKFYNDVEPAMATDAAAALLPQAVEAFVTPTQHDGCGEFPVTYIVCSLDKALTAEYQRSAVDVIRTREGRKGGPDAVEMVTLESGHSPFLNMPEECAAIIKKAAGEVS